MSIEQNITHEAESTIDVAEGEEGQVFFLVTLIILVLVIIAAYFIVRMGHKPPDEEEADDTSIVVELEPAEPEEAPTETPEPMQRPVPTARRPQPKVVEEPVEEDKPLSDQEADVDIKADESEQEGSE
jgi:cell division protein FtsN